MCVEFSIRLMSLGVLQQDKEISVKKKCVTVFVTVMMSNRGNSEEEKGNIMLFNFWGED